MDNMKASDHLKWIHDRLVEVHGENANVDYLIRMREIIDEMEYKENPIPNRRTYSIDMGDMSKDPKKVIEYLMGHLHGSLHTHYSYPTEDQTERLKGIESQANWDNSDLKILISDYHTAIDRIDKYRGYCGISIRCKYNGGALKVLVEQINDNVRPLSPDELIERAMEMVGSFVFNKPITIRYFCNPNRKWKVTQLTNKQDGK